MPFVVDPEELDRVTFKKGPGSVHDRVLRIAFEVFGPDSELEGPLTVYSRFGVDFEDGSLESLEFFLKVGARIFPSGPKTWAFPMLVQRVEGWWIRR